jgi:hypothetical protein
VHVTSENDLITPKIAALHFYQMALTGSCRPVVTGENPANYVFVDLDVERQGYLMCDSRTAQLGLRCFISTTKWMSSALGPFGPGFRWRFGENSIRYFRLLMAL